MTEPLSPCSYPGCFEPVVTTSPAKPLCLKHLTLLFKMTRDPEFRRQVMEKLAKAEKGVKSEPIFF